jgi:hypothetical protein
MLILQPKFKVYLNLMGKDNTMIQVLNEHLFILLSYQQNS